jgi:hypothetical protein
VPLDTVTDWAAPSVAERPFPASRLDTQLWGAMGFLDNLNAKVGDSVSANSSGSGK